jgi:hypothetical protein
MKTILNLAHCCLLFCLVYAPFAVADEYASNVIVATDFSTSYYFEDRFELIADNFDVLSSAVTSRATGLGYPSLFQVIPIDELSQARRPICEWTIQVRKLISREDACAGEKRCSDDPRDAAQYISDICSKAVIARGVGGATDIEGALSLAGQLAASQKAEKNYLFIFSDMEEYRREEVQSTPPDLAGFDVMVVCSGDLGEAGFCMSERKSWSEKLKSFGASKVEFVIESSKWNRVAMEMFE